MTVPPDFVAVLPLVAAVLAATAVLLVDLALPGRRTAVLLTALVALVVVALAVIAVGGEERVAFGGAYTVDALTTFLHLLFVAIIALTVMFGPDYLVPRGLPVAEFAIMLIFAMTGAMLLAASTDLLLLFLGLELMVLPGYLLAAFHKSDGYSTEGAIIGMQVTRSRLRPWPPSFF